MSTVLGGVGRGVQGDDEQAGLLAPCLSAALTRVAVGGDQDALVAAGDGVLDRGDLGLGVAVRLARGDGQLDVVLAPPAFASSHADEVRVGEGLDDQRDADLLARGRARAAGPAAAGRRALLPEPLPPLAAGLLLPPQAASTSAGAMTTEASAVRERTVRESEFMWCLRVRQRWRCLDGNLMGAYGSRGSEVC